jgi:hypothetical protein
MVLVEVSKDLNDWIASVPNGTPDEYNILSFPNSVFWTDDTIKALNKSYVWFLGQNSIFLRKNQLPGLAKDIRGRSHWLFDGCSHFIYSDISVTGEADRLVLGYVPSKEAQHAFCHKSSSYGISTNCKAGAIWGDAFNFAPNATYKPSAHHQIVNFFGGTAHRDSVSCTMADDIIFSDCKFGYSWRSGVDLEPNGNEWSVTNIRFEDCSWQGHRFNLLSAVPRHGIVTDIKLLRCTSVSPIQVATYCDPNYILPNQPIPRRANFTIDSCNSGANTGNPSSAVFNFRNTEGFVK